MTAAPRTLADILEDLARLDHLPARTRADLASALRCFCRVADLDPATTLAGDLGALQQHLAGVRPERSGLSPARWSVIRSQVLRALEVTGAAKPLRTAATRLTPGWADLMGAIEATRQRMALSRFGRFCCQKGVEPSGVDPDTFAQFREALLRGSLVRNPEGVYRDTVRAWSALPVGLGGVSRSPIAVPPLATAQSRRGRHPLTAFPEAFSADLQAFQRWCETADPLDEEMRPRALRPQTVISYCSNLHTAADAAVRAGVPIGEITSIAVLTRPEVYKQVLRRTLADHDGKPSANAQGVATVLPIVARDWLRQSPEEIAELKRLKGKLPKLRPGLTDKNREFLATFEDRALLARFLALGDILWKEALSDKLPRNQRLVRAQMALLIGILQITPLRRKNACSLMFDHHITWPNGPAGEAIIHIPTGEGKTDLDYVGELPLDLSRRLHHYRTRLAPALIGSVPTHLFVRSDGKPKTQEAVTNRLVRVLGQRLGIDMSMHQFRHLCGKLMLDANPGAHEAAAQLLGHNGTKNIVKFYGGADTRRATRHHAALIEKLRAEAKGPNRPRRRKSRGPR